MSGQENPRSRKR